MAEPMFIGPNSGLYAVITLCSLMGLIILAVAELLRQELEARKLDRRWDKIIERSK